MSILFQDGVTCNFKLLRATVPSVAKYKIAFFMLFKSKKHMHKFRIKLFVTLVNKNYVSLLFGVVVSKKLYT